MIAVLNRPHEFIGYVRGALTSEVIREHIRHVCMQIAVYYGFPARLDFLGNALGVIGEDN
jgi:alkylhydroperoxidase/carboxymuconolactone decarboxylase family protein YurZ